MIDALGAAAHHPYTGLSIRLDRLFRGQPGADCLLGRDRPLRLLVQQLGFMVTSLLGLYRSGFSPLHPRACEPVRF